MEQDVQDDVATVQLVELLSELGPIVSKARFGGYALFLEDRIFAVVRDGAAYFRTDETTSWRYEALGAEALQPADVNGDASLARYLAVPAHVLRNADLACAWAYEAVATDA